MSSFASALKAEIARVARREVKEEVSALRKASTQYRRRIAELSRQNHALTKRVGFLESQERKRPKPEASDTSNGKVRFSPKMIAGHRGKLGLSQADYAKLVGVSSVSIYKWEQGKSRPRAQQLAAWAAVRHLSKREAKLQLEKASK
jgi:DNA-binding transcriptional regulator YiaG